MCIVHLLAIETRPKILIFEQAKFLLLLLLLNYHLLDCREPLLGTSPENLNGVNGQRKKRNNAPKFYQLIYFVIFIEFFCGRFFDLIFYFPLHFFFFSFLFFLLLSFQQKYSKLHFFSFSASACILDLFC